MKVQRGRKLRERPPGGFYFQLFFGKVEMFEVVRQRERTNEWRLKARKTLDLLDP